MPSGWSHEYLAGSQPFLFVISNNPNAAGGPSIDGTCMAIFDDDILGNAVQPLTTRLVSPAFDATTKANIVFNVDVHFRTWGDSYFRILVWDGEAWQTIKNYIGQDYSGPMFSDFVHETFNLSAYRNAAMKIAFEYSDANDWAWWAGFDNVVVTGDGTLNDICANATTVPVDGTCITQSNTNTVFTGPQNACASSQKSALWYKFVAPAGGNVTLKTNATFNDVISVYSGNCNSLTAISCKNDYTYGFEGEMAYLTGLSAGQTYFVRVGASVGTWGSRYGDVCLSITQGNSLPATPGNDACANATTLTSGSSCIEGNNLFAVMDGPAPLRNTRSAHSIWYKFTPPAGGKVQITTNANFAEVLSVLNGTCSGFSEVASTENGETLLVTGLNTNLTYYIQVAGIFSSVDGQICIAINTPPPAPENDLCANAILLTLNDPCISGSTNGASYETTGLYNSCTMYPANSIWYKFIAPASGKVYLQTNGDFPHIITLFTGTCGNFTECMCFDNPSSCSIGELISVQPSTIYYVQIVTNKNTPSVNTGDVCVAVTDATAVPVKVKIKAYLQGAYQSAGNMTTLLQDYGLVPTSQPYNTAPWFFMGNTCTDYVQANGVDWVLIELLDQNTHQIVARKAAILLNNGTIVDPNRTDGINFYDIAENTPYYIVVRHRNHLAVVSSVPVSFPNAVPYNFGGGASYVLGGANQIVMSNDGVSMLIAGDNNADGIITVADFNIYAADASKINQYLPADINLDKNVTVSDFNTYQPNASKIGHPWIHY